MKNLLLATLLLFANFSFSYAQEDENVKIRTSSRDDIRTLGGNKNKKNKHSHNGAYIGIDMKAASFNNQFVGLMGARASWVVNRTLGIGFQVDGIIPATNVILPTQSINVSPTGGYGGFTLEPILFSNKAIHFTFPVTAGAGWMGYLENNTPSNDFSYSSLLDEDIFWFAEVGANVEFNISKMVRLDVGASWKKTENLLLFDTPTTAFDGMNYFIMLKFGSF